MVQSEFAVFVDRDGTINVDVDFLSSPSQIQLIPRSADAIRILNEREIPVVVITNQSGIARGLFSEKDLSIIHRAMDDELKKFDASVLDYFYCPHHPTDGIPQYRTDCECRKPKPGMLMQAKEKYGFDLSRCFVIGDKCIDAQTGKSVGAVSIQVATGYGAQEKDSCSNQRDYYATDLYDAVQYITKKLRT
ncbi:MAG: HAD family hydrolase [Ignavibacteriales bacterium]|nr:HAD family hydrolase [Ignavibacteriales bacterium]